MAKVKFFLVAGGVLVSLLVPSVASAGIVTSTYTVTDLGTLGGAGSHAWAINNSGQVVGEAQTASGAWHAFLWDSESGMRDLGTMSYGTSLATDINDNGVVVGRAVGAAAHAFVWTEAGGMQPLRPQQYSSEAWSINNSGHIAGFSQQASGGQYHGFLYKSSSNVKDLGQYAALGVNGSDWAVGEIPDPSGAEAGRGVLWRGASTVWLPSNTYQARSVNANGWVVGRTLEYAGTTPAYAFLWDGNNGLRTIGPSASVSSAAYAVNDAGVVVGDANSGTGSYPCRAFTWDAVNGTVYLDTLLDTSESEYGWHVSSALDINNAGQIVGTGYDIGMPDDFNSLHAILLTPGPTVGAPEPASLALMLAGAACLLRRRAGARLGRPLR
jgi:probable HAF family extracellular repeat protein